MSHGRRETQPADDYRRRWAHPGAADLWEKYLEAQYRPRAIRIKKDSEGWEYAEIDGKPATCIDKYNLPRLSSMGRFVQEMRERRKVWLANGKKGPRPSSRLPGTRPI